MLNRKIPAYASIVTLFLGAGGVLLLTGHSEPTTTTPVLLPAPVATGAFCDYSIKRVSGFGHVQPLLYAEPVCEAPRFAPVKANLLNILGNAKKSGQVKRASVYVRDLSRGDWFAINADDRFEPGSLMKVPTMMACLMQAEAEPAFGRGVFRTNVDKIPLDQFYPPSEEPRIGKDYSLEEVLNFSICKSSNVAETMLLQRISKEQYERLLLMVGLDGIAGREASYPISPKEYSQFLKAIYNTSVLSPLTAEMAIKLLIKSDFKEGLRRGIPEEIDVASKFGETGPDKDRQFHEAAIVFAPGKTYLMVVMTNGSDTQTLTDLVAEVSREVYTFISDPKH